MNARPFALCFLVLLLLAASAHAATVTWVPKFGASNTCPQTGLSDDATYYPDGTWVNNTLVTDEWSLLCRATAAVPNPNSTHEARMVGFYNLLSYIESPTYRNLSVWKVHRINNTITSSVGTNDSANDATAVTIQCLAIASNNPGYSAGNRSLWNATADSMCRAMVQNEIYVDTTGYNVNFSSEKAKYYAKTGSDNGDSLADGTGVFIDYAGQTVNALLMCNRMHANATLSFVHRTQGAFSDSYCNISRGVVLSTLQAVNFNGTALSFNGKAGHWVNSTGGTNLNNKNQTLRFVCDQDCNPFDYDDGSRHTRLCEATYWGNMSGCPMPAELATYCNLWHNSSGITNTTYIPQWYDNSTPSGSAQNGYFENGLAGSLDYTPGWTSQAAARIEQIDSKLDSAQDRYFGDTCYGNFRQPHAAYTYANYIGLTSAAYGGTASSYLVNPNGSGIDGKNYSYTYRDYEAEWFFTGKNSSGAEYNVTQTFDANGGTCQSCNSTGPNSSNNTAPIVTAVNITPQPLADNDDPRAHCTVIDNQSTSLTCYYAWFKNGVYQFEGNTACANNTDNTISIYDHAQTTQSDTLIVGCRVDDGNLNSTWVNSTSRTIGTPIVNLSNISSLTSTVTSNLSLTCGGYDTENDRVNYNYIVYRNGTLNLTGSTNPVFTGMCYQETANVSTSCGGLATGRYDPNGVNEQGHYEQSGLNYFPVNYTKPVGANNYSLWKTTHGQYSAYNSSIPLSCWNYNASVLVLRFYSNYGGCANSISSGQCYNGTTWVNMTNISTVPSGSSGGTMACGDLYWDGNESTGCYALTSGGYWTSSNQNFGCAQSAVLYEEGMWWNISSANGINASVNVLNITAGMVKNQNWTLSCAANDSYTVGDYLNSSVFTIQNSVPNASSLQIRNITNALNCTYVYNDSDLDAQNGTTFRWFKNNTVLASTQPNLTSGNYSVGDQLKCEVLPSDGVSNGSRVNSSTFVIGDLVAPVIMLFSFPSSGSTSDILTLSVNCTDTNSLADGFPKVQWTNPNGIIDANLSLVSAGGTLYARAYTFNTVGDYHDFVAYCQDGSGNIATNTSNATLSISAGATAPAGPSSSSDDSSSDDGCSFRILQPQEGTDATNPYCPVGGKSNPFSVQILNLCASTKEFSLDIPDGRCTSDPKTLSIAGNSKGTILLQDCLCPVDKTKTEEFTVTVRQADHTSSFKVRLSSNSLLAFFASPTALLLVITVFVLGIIVVSFIAYVIHRLRHGK